MSSNIPRQALIQLDIVGPPASVALLVETIRAARLHWFQLEDVSDPTTLDETLDRARVHVTALVTRAEAPAFEAIAPHFLGPDPLGRR